jgi:hypothetical protein
MHLVGLRFLLVKPDIRHASMTCDRASNLLNAQFLHLSWNEAADVNDDLVEDTIRDRTLSTWSGSFR